MKQIINISLFLNLIKLQDQMIGGVILAVLFLVKSNLVLNPEFVNEIKITIKDNSKNINILSLIHEQHFNNDF